MRSISKSYKQLNEQQMMMGMQGGMQQFPMPQQKKTYHYPFRKQTQGPIQDQGPASLEPPKPQGTPFPGPGMPGEIPGPSGLPVAGQEQSVPMMSQMGRQMPQMGQMGQQMPQMGQMGQQMPQMGRQIPQTSMGQIPQMGQPQQPQIQIAQMGTFKQPFGEVPGQLGQMGQMGQAPMMGQMGQSQFGAPGQSIQQALSRTRPITKIETLENPGIPDEFRYTPRPEQQPQMGMAQAPTGQMPQQGQTTKPLPTVPSLNDIKQIMNKIKNRGQPKR